VHNVITAMSNPNNRLGTLGPQSSLERNLFGTTDTTCDPKDQEEIAKLAASLESDVSGNSKSIIFKRL
jgi:hypothetical protein